MPLDGGRGVAVDPEVMPLGFDADGGADGVVQFGLACPPPEDGAEIAGVLPAQTGVQVKFWARPQSAVKRDQTARAAAMIPIRLDEKRSA